MVLRFSLFQLRRHVLANLMEIFPTHMNVCITSAVLPDMRTRDIAQMVYISTLNLKDVFILIRTYVLYKKTNTRKF